MEYLLFTMPGCLKCDALKADLKARGAAWQEFNLVHKEAKAKLREYREVIKRDETGAVILPDAGAALGAVHSSEELDGWLRSRA